VLSALNYTSFICQLYLNKAEKNRYVRIKEILKYGKYFIPIKHSKIDSKEVDQNKMNLNLTHHL
jgi:hypothetical protein